MSDEDYKKIIKRHKPKDDKLKHAVISFISGGIIGILTNFLVFIFNKLGMSSKDTTILVMLLYIFLSCLFTSMGFFDKWVSYFLCGLIIPITGFAHSVCSAMFDYKKDGLITGIGSNAFKLAGSVLVYGIVSAFIFCILKVIIYG